MRKRWAMRQQPSALRRWKRDTLQTANSRPNVAKPKPARHSRCVPSCVHRRRSVHLLLRRPDPLLDPCVRPTSRPWTRPPARPSDVKESDNLRWRAGQCERVGQALVEAVAALANIDGLGPDPRPPAGKPPPRGVSGSARPLLPTTDREEGGVPLLRASLRRLHAPGGLGRVARHAPELAPSTIHDHVPSKPGQPRKAKKVKPRLEGGGRVADGGWKVTDGGWRVTDGGWRVSDGGGRVTDGNLTVTRALPEGGPSCQKNKRTGKKLLKMIRWPRRGPPLPQRNGPISVSSHVLDHKTRGRKPTVRAEPKPWGTPTSIQRLESAEQDLHQVGRSCRGLGLVKLMRQRQANQSKHHRRVFVKSITCASKNNRN